MRAGRVCRSPVRHRALKDRGSPCHQESKREGQLVCERFEWRRSNGKLKEMSCRVAMLPLTIRLIRKGLHRPLDYDGVVLRMERGGLLRLPAPRQKGPTNYKVIESPDSDPQTELRCSLDDLRALEIRQVERGGTLRRWNEFVGRHHYLGYKMLPGAQIRYFIMNGEQVLGAMGFGAAAWKVAPRDTFIGWSDEERKCGLGLIVGQSRFLILPWIRCHNLASKTLSLVAKRLSDDWERLYGLRPVLLETFVDTTRFQGTCYKASNWLNVGKTQGRPQSRGTQNRHSQTNTSVKSIWLHPLVSDFRRQLRGGGG